ncbi:MAG: hypothetical protein Kow0068_16300 [Marinilabiliales bacterium]
MKATKIVYVILLLIIHLSNMYSQVPEGFNYQGVARDNQGDAITNQNISLRISIHSGSSTGTQLYTETHNLTTNEFGLFSLIIGEGNTSDDFSSIDWSSPEDKWLNIEMDENGGTNFTIIGSNKLYSVPYALYAKNAGNGSSQWTTGSNGIYYSSGSVGIGTSTPNTNAALDVNSSTQGFLPPRMTNEQRDSIINPPVGLMIYNISTDCINIFKSTGWFELCGDCITLSAPACSSNYPVCIGDTLFLYAISAPSAQYFWSGPNGFTSTMQNPVIPNVSGVNSGTYSVYVSNSCGNSPVSTIDVSLSLQPTTANAGPDQTISSTTTTLQGNTPTSGTGLWTIASGNGGTINDPSNPNSIFTGQINEQYSLVWTISNNCGSSSDTLVISIVQSTFTCGDTLIDSRDGQQYPTVLIGTQCWMAKNLNYGTMISASTDQSDNGIVEKFCYNDNSANCNIYGGLYQWDELMGYTTTPGVQGICPTGWHVPTDNEWKTLEMAVGMSQSDADIDNAWRGTDEGTKLKLGGSSGFDALLGGGKFSTGSFSALNSYGYYYTSNEYTANTLNAWRRCFNTTPQIGRWNTFPKTYGFSVRCVKD